MWSQKRKVMQWNSDMKEIHRWNIGWGLPDEGRGTAGGVQVEWLDL